MKFGEMPYKRVDIGDVAARYRAFTDGVKNAGSAQEILAIFKEHEELTKSVETMVTLAHIRKTINTADEFYRAEDEYYDENTPYLIDAIHGFMDAMLETPFRPELEKNLGSLLFVNAEISSKEFRPEIVPMLQEENKLIADYDNLVASAQIPFRGGVYNVSQLAKFKQDPDRAVRKEAFEAEGGFYAGNKEKLDAIFDSLVKVRTKIAKELGYDSFTSVGYLRNTRNCYGPKDVETFRDMVVGDFVPVVCELKKAQARRIGVSDLRFWDDVFLFPDGNPAPKADTAGKLAAAKDMYGKMSAVSGEFFDFMLENDLLDVDAKPGKQVGGYCTELPLYDSPFIFSNFNGTAGDVEVLTHEAGHALASYVANAIDVSELRSPTMESCECHSMSMEFFAWKYLDLFYGDDAGRAKLAHMSGCLSFIPYGCMVDEFQQRCYDSPELTPDERNALWLSLEKKYRPWVDFGDLPFYSAGSGWQRQLHIFECPFYYIDYCLAQTVALMFWSLSQKDYADAFERYFAFVRCGGTKTFKELVAAAGLPDPFSPGALSGAAEEAMGYLKCLS
ncbi:MAG: M3 family oligoendopeptidase [Clostridia bacterium]|nr:M3 family oligoendopeptidase [Clostridia bacterium]